MTQSACKLWIPHGKLKAISTTVPLIDIITAIEGELKTAVLEQSGLLSKLQKSHVLVRTGHWKDTEGSITGAYGYISPRQNHSIYLNGLYLTTHSEIDVNYHLGTRTVTEKQGADRIEVLRPDRGENLDEFVLDAIEMYALLGQKSDERERNLLFYQSLNPNIHYDSA